MKRALIVKLGAIGDVVMAIPAAHRLHALGYGVDWIAGAQAASFLRCYSFVRVIEADENTIFRGTLLRRVQAIRAVWQQFPPGGYDLVATLYYDRRYRLFSLPLFRGRHVRLRRDDRTFQLLPGRHHTDEFARILLSAVGLAGGDDGPVPHSLLPLRPENLPPSPLPASTATRVVLAAGGARNALRDDRLRRWPVENYRALAERLLNAGYEVVLTGGLGDTWVQDAFASLPCTDLIAQLALPELLALFDSSDAVVTHDSGPLHLAGVTSCALLGIFGPVDPWTRLPQRPGAAALWGGEGFACRPCYDGSSYADCHDNICMAQVTPAMTFETLTLLLEQKRGGNQQGPAVYLPQAAAPLVELRAGKESR